MKICIRFIYVCFCLFTGGAYAQWNVARNVDKMDAANVKISYFHRDLNGKLLGGFMVSTKSGIAVSEGFVVTLPSVNGCLARNCTGRLKLGDAPPREIPLFAPTTARMVFLDESLAKEIKEALVAGKKVMVGAPVYRAGEHISEFTPDGFNPNYITEEK